MAENKQDVENTQEVLAQIELKFKELTKGFALDAETKAEIKELKDEFKSLKTAKDSQDELNAKYEKYNEILETQGLILQELKAAKPTSKEASVFDQVKEIFTTNVDGFNGFVNKQAPLTMQLKAVGNMTIGGNVTGATTLLPTPEVIPGYSLVRRTPATFLDVVPVGTTNSARISYVDQDSPEGTAATVTEGSGKPQIDANYYVTTSSAVKVAAYTKISDEMLDDIDFMAQAVSDELISRVRIALNGNIYTYITSDMSPGYTEVSSSFLDYFALAKQASLWDVLTAAKATIQAGNHEPNTVFVNPIEFATLWMQKSSTGEYTQPILVTPSEMYFNGMRIIATTAVASDKYIVCDITKLNVKMYKDLIVEAGWETADFINNMRTFRGECRAHYYVRKTDLTAFLYADLSTSVAYMTAAA